MEKCPYCSYVFSQDNSVQQQPVNDMSSEDFNISLIIVGEGALTEFGANERNLEITGGEIEENAREGENDMNSSPNQFEIVEFICIDTNVPLPVTAPSFEAVTSTLGAGSIQSNHAEISTPNEKFESLDQIQVETLKSQPETAKNDSTVIKSDNKSQKASKVKKSGKVSRKKPKRSSEPAQVLARNDYLCEFCGQDYPGRDGLWRHRYAMHLGLKYQCAICDNSYTRKENLDKHIHRKHTN